MKTCPDLVPLAVCDVLPEQEEELPENHHSYRPQQLHSHDAKLQNKQKMLR